MTLYQKNAGAWAPASMAYVKVNGVWQPVTNAYVKQAGQWKVAHTYDVIPPDPPELAVAIIEHFHGSGAKKTLTGRYINVGVRITGTGNNTDVRRIRVLTTYSNAAPTTYLGGTYTADSASNYPTEPWSEWRYNGFGPHKDTSVIYYKRWPRNATDTFKIKPGQTYHFTAWAEDFAGNWSVPVTEKVVGPKLGVDAANVVSKQARFQADASGSISNGAYAAGPLIQRISPFSQGVWFYGNQINEAIGQTGTPTITSAQLYVARKDDDGVATANVYLAAHGYSTPGSVPATNRAFTNPVKLGTISKGEGKWFNIPSSYYAGLNTTTRGFSLLTKDPVKASSMPDDYTQVRGIDETLRSGELVVTWNEQL